MGKHVFLAMTNAVAGEEAAFDAWYDAHLRELLCAEGCVAVQRFSLDAAQMMHAQPFRYLALYEIETEDPAAVMAALGSRAGSLGLSPAMDGPPLVSLFTPIGPRVTREAAG